MCKLMVVGNYFYVNGEYHTCMQVVLVCSQNLSTVTQKYHFLGQELVQEVNHLQHILSQNRWKNVTAQCSAMHEWKKKFYMADINSTCHLPLTCGLRKSLLNNMQLWRHTIRQSQFKSCDHFTKMNHFRATLRLQTFPFIIDSIFSTFWADSAHSIIHFPRFLFIF